MAVTAIASMTRVILVDIRTPTITIVRQVAARISRITDSPAPETGSPARLIRLPIARLLPINANATMNAYPASSEAATPSAKRGPSPSAVKVYRPPGATMRRAN